MIEKTNKYKPSFSTLAWQGANMGGYYAAHVFAVLGGLTGIVLGVFLTLALSAFTTPAAILLLIPKLILIPAVAGFFMAAAAAIIAAPVVGALSAIPLAFVAKRTRQFSEDAKIDTFFEKLEKINDINIQAEIITKILLKDAQKSLL